MNVVILCVCLCVGGDGGRQDYLNNYMPMHIVAFWCHLFEGP